jgi:hypothetical protein
MKKHLKNLLFLVLYFYSINLYALSLSETAKERGINETCLLFLNQIEESFGLNGLNITFAHPDNPSFFPTLHVSTQNYNNGASIFSATLSPSQEKCFVSTIVSTSINGQSCKQVSKLKIEQDGTLKVDSYNNDSYTILTPPNNNFQIILTSAGNENCLMTETSMVWPEI